MKDQLLAPWLMLALPHVMRYAFAGIGCVTLVVLVYAQITSGTSFPVVRFRSSEPRAFWAVVGAYGLLFVIIAFGFLARH